MAVFYQQETTSTWRRIQPPRKCQAIYTCNRETGEPSLQGSATATPGTDNQRETVHPKRAAGVPGIRLCHSSQ